jgi:hypothetical protein
MNGYSYLWRNSFNPIFFPHKLRVTILDFWVKFGEISSKRSHYSAIRWISKFEVAYSFVHILLLGH